MPKAHIKQSPLLTVRQRTVLAPQLYQGLKVLRMGAAELQQLIQDELNENPVLELPEPVDPGLTVEPQPYRELWNEYIGANRVHDSGRQGETPHPNPVELTASPTTLAEHLGVQLELQDLTKAQKRIGRAIIGSLDDNGYLRDTIASLSETTGEPSGEVEKVLAVIQGFDPPGIAARSLEECLLNQMDPDDAQGLPGKIVSHCLPQLGRGSIGRIARMLSEDRYRIEYAISLIRRLSPSPGSQFDTSPPAGAAIPDVFIRKSGDGWAILANREITPSLSISRDCERLVEKLADADAREYIKAKSERARQLIRDVNQRRLTLTRVARAIANAQEEFFEKGRDSLKPMNLDDIARVLDVNPSTVSRAIQGKYMSTPFGIFEFKFFFSTGYAVASGPDLSATALKERLKKMIAAEDGRRPLSDQKLADALKRESISISRRTVTKYREELGLPASWQRKNSA